MLRCTIQKSRFLRLVTESPLGINAQRSENSFLYAHTAKIIADIVLNTKQLQ